MTKTFTKTRTSKSNSKKKEKKNNKYKKNKDNNKTQINIIENDKKGKSKENEKINNDKSRNSNIIIINSSQNESVNEEEGEKRMEYNNNEFYKFSFGANFEYNSLHFLLYGISEFINLPRIVFYPLFDFKDYEEIYSVFIIKKKMKIDIDDYYKNFKSFDLQKENLNDRDEFKLGENDIVLI